MKRWVAAFTLLITFLVGNPIDPTQFYINEVFLKDSTWIIELPWKFTYTSETFDDFLNDTLIFRTTSDSIYYPVRKMKFFEEYCCLCSDSIDKNIGLNPDYEIIFLEIKDTMVFSYHSELIWGSTDIFNLESHSENPAIIPGASLSRENDNIISPEFLFKYYLDMSPTIGVKNDSIDATGSLVISIHDSCGNFMPATINSIGIYSDISGSKEFSVLASYYFLLVKPFYSNNVEDWLSRGTIVYPDSILYLDFVFPTKYTSIELEENLTSQYTLSQNYPNPFNPTTTFKYAIPKRTNVELSIFDLHGNLIEKLVSETLDAGEYQKIWNASEFSSGLYFYQLKTLDVALRKKCLVVK
ncbi:MAG: T9SS type A sorting domain-containing protein [Candidatus Marinimicrobia bacterium]|nr:T9SS type A sorting domain-containing protein [Candidatus Neomarinimicrobiota bacterium]